MPPPAHLSPAAPTIEIRLPLMRRALFGRAREMAWLDACWEGGVQVAAVVAWGGVGKTSLVTRWLATLQDDGWRGAEAVFAWSFYGQGTKQGSSDAFVEAALKWFGDAESAAGSAWEKGERLAALVRAQRTLLVLDGVEPLQSAVGVIGKVQDPALEALLRALGRGSHASLCVITSRLAVTDLEGMAGEKVVVTKLSHLSPEAGAALLREKGVEGPEEELQEASREHEGHALALALLGSYLRDVAKGDIRRRKEIGPLTGDPAEGGHARRMMTAYEPGLSGVELAILRVIGLFDRPATEGEIGALKKEPVIVGLTDALAGVRERRWSNAVSRLRRVGLLGEEQGHGLDAHPLVREHFGEQLRREQPEAWREGHRRLYEHLRESATELPDTVEEMAPLYAAVVHGCLAGKNKQALDEVWWRRIERHDQFFSTTKLGGYGSEVAVLSAFFDPPWERLSPGLSNAAQAFVVSQAGFALRALGRLSEAAGLMRLGLEMGIAQRDWEEAAIRAENLSDLLQSHGDLGEAVTQARKSVDLADESGSAFQRMASRATLAGAMLAMGRREEAAAHFERAERMQREREPAYPRLYSLQGFQYCDLLFDQGRDAEVRERAAQTLAWFEARYSLLSVALDHLSIGRAHLLGAQRGRGGDVAQAATHLAQAVDGLRRAGTQHHVPLGLLARAALHLHERSLARAHEDLAESLSLCQRCGLRCHLVDTHLAYGRLHLAERRIEEAREHVAEAGRLIGETGYHRRDGELAELAHACAVFGGPEAP